MEEMYNVSSNPHVRDKMTTSRIMQLVVIALLPTTLFGIWNFGFRAFLVVLVTVASSVFFIMKKEVPQIKAAKNSMGLASLRERLDFIAFHSCTKLHFYGKHGRIPLL